MDVISGKYIPEMDLRLKTSNFFLGIIIRVRPARTQRTCRTSFLESTSEKSSAAERKVHRSYYQMGLSSNPSSSMVQMPDLGQVTKTI